MMWLVEGGTPHPRGADLSLGGMCTREGGREGKGGARRGRATAKSLKLLVVAPPATPPPQL